MPPDRLCAVCRKLSFDKLVKQSMEQPWKVWQLFSSSRPSEKLGTWREIQRKSSCPFCRLVVECIHAVVVSTSGGLPEPGDVIELSNRPSWKMCILIFNFNGSLHKVFSNRADLEQEARNIRLIGGVEAQRLLISWSHCRAFGEIQCLGADPRLPRGLTFHGRAVRRAEPNWPLLRWWLRHCSHCHGNACQGTTHAKSARRELPDNMRVIDVDDYCVVPYRTGSEYVALTYVWGEHLMGRSIPTMDRARAENAPWGDKGIPLPEWIPKTVSDAIEAVRLLGYRYIWVDALCIIQDDKADKHDQILRMDAIYRNASLSIAAASGDHADSGLPGMSVPRKYKQPRETVSGGLTLAVPLPRFDQLNEGNLLKWNTRAWTFQEKVLSRRLLIFTDFQVYFRCSNGVWSEDVAAETTPNLAQRRSSEGFFCWGDEKLPHDYSTRRPYSLVDFLNFGSMKLANIHSYQGSFANYTAVVEEYTQRDLTYRQDALPAIDGVLRVLDPAESAYVAGLPRRFFDEAMLWQPKFGSTCVEVTGTGAPSWSWASWSLPDGCTWMTRDVRSTTKYQQAYPFMFYWTLESGPSPISQSNTTTYMHVRPSGITPLIERHLEKSGSLLSWNAARIRLSLGHKVDLSELGSEDTVAAFHIFNDWDESIGEVITTGGMWAKFTDWDFMEISRGQELEFVSNMIPDRLRPTTTETKYVQGQPIYGSDNAMEIVGRKEGHYETKTTVDPEDTWKVVNVLMVERVGEVWYRRGIGKVISTAWEKMKTSPEIVYLA
ncbi:heterokaryon incompatibility protein-domain-containing protein [Apodospora peruviana]|uniref:Heterokaryon incompatibility protein-domain-containing protein n=1 Tax=Apodospora peruviana TaxID=516989 RepID=A0AAE0HTK8_9PEZI|nr:heterokaryon incompatibility protein-domain-containing protein [Apodospora peruviana]